MSNSEAITLRNRHFRHLKSSIYEGIDFTIMPTWTATAIPGEGISSTNEELQKHKHCPIHDGNLAAILTSVAQT